MFRIAVLAVFVVSCQCMQLTRYISCGGTTAVHYFEFTPCTHEPCVVHRLNTTYTAHVNFTATETSQEAHTTLFVKHDWGFGIRQANFIKETACGNGLKCPVQKGLAEVYTASFTVQLLPSAKLAAKLEVRNENSNYILCLVFPIDIME